MKRSYIDNPLKKNSFLQICLKAALSLCLTVAIVTIFNVRNYEILGVTGIPLNSSLFLTPDTKELKDITDSTLNEGFLNEEEWVESDLLYGMATERRKDQGAATEKIAEDMEVLGINRINETKLSDSTWEKVLEAIINDEQNPFIGQNPFMEFIYEPNAMLSPMSMNYNIPSYGFSPHFPGYISDFSSRYSSPNISHISTFVAPTYSYYITYNPASIDSEIFTVQAVESNYTAPSLQTTGSPINLSEYDVVIGQDKDDSYTQSGTTITAKNLGVAIGEGVDGEYVFSSGELYIHPGSGNDASEGSYTEYIGFKGQGTFTHLNGRNITYNMLVGTFEGSDGSYILDGGSLYADHLIIGYSGVGSFEQNMNNGSGVLNSSYIFLGYNEGAKGYLTLNGASYVHSNDYNRDQIKFDIHTHSIFLGYQGLGELQQDGGNMRVDYLLSLAGSFDATSSYTKKDGITDAYLIVVGDRGEGIMNIEGGLLTSEYTLLGNGMYISTEDFAPYCDSEEQLNRLWAELIEKEYIEENGRITDTFWSLDTVYLSDEFMSEQFMYEPYENADPLNIIYTTIRDDKQLTKGTIVQTGADTRCEITNLVLSSQKGGTGVYELWNGTLETDNTYLGYAGESQFIQYGGTHIVNNDLRIATHNLDVDTNPSEVPELSTTAKEGDPGFSNIYTSSYDLLGGTLDVKGSIRGGSGICSLKIDGGILHVADDINNLETCYIGYENQGTHTQDGGNYSFGTLALGFMEGSEGMYNLQNEATCTIQSSYYGYQINGNAYVGYNGTGTVSVDETSALTIENDLFVGHNVGSKGTVNLAGTLNVANNTYVGYNATDGTVNQTAGNFTTGTLYVGSLPQSDYYGVNGYHIGSSSNAISNDSLYLNGGLIESQSNPTAGLTTMTVSVWVNPDAYRWYAELSDGTNLNGNFKLVSTAWWSYGVASGWILGINYPELWDTNNNDIRQEVTQDNIEWKKGEWNHHVIVYDGTTMYEYVNGELNQQMEASGTPLGFGKNLEIGAWLPFTAYNTYGFMDEVLIYDRALTQDDIDKLYDKDSYAGDFISYAEDNDLDSDIIAYYSFDAGNIDDQSYIFRDESTFETSTYRISGDSNLVTDYIYVGPYGNIEQSGGTVADQSDMVVYGSFTQSGGTTNIANSLYVLGSFAISGDSNLTADYIYVSPYGNIEQSGGTITVKQSVDTTDQDPDMVVYGTFNQAGGTADITYDMELYGNFNQSGGITHIANDLSVYGILTQSGGTTDIDYDLMVYGNFTQSGGGSVSAKTLTIDGSDSQSTANYNLFSGTLTNSSCTVGGNNSGEFIQTAGQHITDELNIKQTGRYSISGGELEADKIIVRGNLTIMGTPSITVDDYIAFQSGASVTLIDAIFSFGVNDLLYSEYLTLIVEGTDNKIEVSGIDMGADEAGYDDNYSLPKLKLYGTVTLINDQDLDALRTAIYIDKVYLLSGAEIIYNDLSLYCDLLIFENGEKIESYNGQDIFNVNEYMQARQSETSFQIQPAPVPEPSALALSLFGIPLLMYCIRKYNTAS